MAEFLLVLVALWKRCLGRVTRPEIGYESFPAGDSGPTDQPSEGIGVAVFFCSATPREWSSVQGRIW